jgi:uncharacterized SAM-binding protein YcdF (DUF218 family)
VPVAWAPVPRTRVIVFGISGALVVAWIAATVRLIFVPTEDAPGKADAVVVLSGSKHQRLDRGLELMREGVAPTLVISGGYDPRQPRASQLCRAGHNDGFRVLCFTPDPDSTQGEAEEVGRLAAEHRWRRVLIVTSRFHVTRARMLFDRCLAGDADAVGVSYPSRDIPTAVVGEWVKLGWALTVARGC